MSAPNEAVLVSDPNREEPTVMTTELAKAITEEHGGNVTVYTDAVDPRCVASPAFIQHMDAVLAQGAKVRPLIDRMTELRSAYLAHLKKGGAKRKPCLPCRDPQKPQMEEEQEVGTMMGTEGNAFKQLYNQFIKMNSEEMAAGRVMLTTDQRAKSQECEATQSYFGTTFSRLMAIEGEIRGMEQRR